MRMQAERIENQRSKNKDPRSKILYPECLFYRISCGHLCLIDLLRKYFSLVRFTSGCPERGNYSFSLWEKVGMTGSQGMLCMRGKGEALVIAGICSVRKLALSPLTLAQGFARLLIPRRGVYARGLICLLVADRP
jgi:hypothetical protein